MKRNNMFFSDETDERLRKMCFDHKVKIGPLVDMLIAIAPAELFEKAAKKVKETKQQEKTLMQSIKARLGNIDAKQLDKLLNQAERARK